MKILREGKWPLPVTIDKGGGATSKDGWRDRQILYGVIDPLPCMPGKLCRVLGLERWRALTQEEFGNPVRRSSTAMGMTKENGQRPTRGPLAKWEPTAPGDINLWD